VNALAGPFQGRSIIDLEAIRAQTEDELAAARESGSPRVEALEAHLAYVADEIVARGLVGQ
jgi:hypothetical protein